MARSASKMPKRPRESLLGQPAMVGLTVSRYPFHEKLGSGAMGAQSRSSAIASLHNQAVRDVGWCAE